MASSGRSKRRGKDAALLALSLTGHGKLAAAFKSLLALGGHRREAKTRRMWECALRDAEDPLEFTRHVEAALAEDGDVVGDAFILAAQAAADVVALSVLPSIGLLARRYLTQQLVDLPTYRAVLGLLKNLDDGEFGALRDAVATITKALNTEKHIDPTRDVQTMLSLDKKHQDDPGRWVWIAGMPYKQGHERDSRSAVRLVEGELATRMVSMLLGNDRPLFERAKEAAPTAGPVFSRSMLELFASIMPRE